MWENGVGFVWSGGISCSCDDVFTCGLRFPHPPASAKINLASEAPIMHLDVRTIDYCVHSVWSVWRWVATLKCVRSVVAILGYLPCCLTHFTTPSHLRIYHSSTLLPEYVLETTRLLYSFPAFSLTLRKGLVLAKIMRLV